MWLARHELPPVPSESSKERISHLHVRPLAPVSLLLFIPFLLRPLVFVNNPLREGDDLPRLRVNDLPKRDVRVAKVFTCAIDCILERGRRSGMGEHQAHDGVLGEGSELDFQNLGEVSLAGRRELERHFWRSLCEF